MFARFYYLNDNGNRIGKKLISKKVLVLALSSMAVLFCGQACAPPQGEISQSNLPNIQTLLVGDYIGMTDKGEVYHNIAKLHVPQFGGDIFYHHISRDSLGGPAMFRKIYAFDESGKQMRSIVLRGRNEVFVDEQTMTRKLNELTESSLLRFPEGCQFQWISTAEGFVGAVFRDKCSYESPAFGGLVSPEVAYKLSDCGLDISETILFADDSPVFPPSTTNNRRISAKAGVQEAPLCRDS